MKRTLLLLAAGSLLAAGDVLAQRSQTPQQRSGRGDANLPAWATPNRSSSNGSYRSPSQREGRDGTDAQYPGAVTNAPGPPESASQAPLGGLEWLALAGGAYAVHRLHRRRKDDDAGDDARP